MSNAPLKLQILISGTGSNALSIIRATQSGHLQSLAIVEQVIANTTTAKGLQLAAEHSIDTHCVAHAQFESKAEFEQALLQQINAKPCDLLVLAGFMRVLSADFIDNFNCKIINIHPSLLPKFKGLNTHQRVLDAAQTQHGISVHLVIADLDAGPILGQAKLEVYPHDTVQSLQQRIQVMEHWLYPYCIKLIASGEIHLKPNTLAQNQAVPFHAHTGVTLWTEQDILAAQGLTGAAH